MHLQDPLGVHQEVKPFCKKANDHPKASPSELVSGPLTFFHQARFLRAPTDRRLLRNMRSVFPSAWSKFQKTLPPWHSPNYPDFPWGFPSRGGISVIGLILNSFRADWCQESRKVPGSGPGEVLEAAWGLLPGILPSWEEQDSAGQLNIPGAGPSCPGNPEPGFLRTTCYGTRYMNLIPHPGGADWGLKPPQNPGNPLNCED